MQGFLMETLIFYLVTSTLWYLLLAGNVLGLGRKVSSPGDAFRKALAYGLIATVLYHLAGLTGPSP